MAGATSSVEGVLADFPIPILPKIVGEPTREALIDLHRILISNAASIVSNLGGGHHDHLALTMTADDYLAQTGHTFVPPHNPGDYPPTLGTAQEQTLGTEIFRQNQVLFRWYTAVDGALKEHMITAVEPVLLSPIKDQLKRFGQVTALEMTDHLFRAYGAIDEIDLEENAVKMMGTYNPAELLARLIEQLEKG